jgi:hypothetical protein
LKEESIALAKCEMQQRGGNWLDFSLKTLKNTTQQYQRTDERLYYPRR